MQKEIFDFIRNIKVPAFPEEIVRQELLCKMVHNLQFPKSYLSVEKDLSSLPHLENTNFNSKNRRADIICFAKNISEKFPLYPLLMIECKAIPLTNDVIDQVLGYNHFVKAFFVAIANKDEIFTLWYDQREKGYKKIDFLPNYKQMLLAAKKIT